MKLTNLTNNMRFQHQGNPNIRRCPCAMPISANPCQRERDILYGLPIAMAYVPWQEWRNIYDVQKGFHHGTIFEELDKPFQGKGGCNR